MENKQVKELMETNLELISPDATLQEAAQRMKECGCGFLPVGNKDNPEGIITDRDIVVRAIAEGKDPSQVKVRECMTDEVCACRETDSLEDAAQAMNKHNVSRLVIRDASDKICGILTFGRLIRSNSDKQKISKCVGLATGKAA